MMSVARPALLPNRPLPEDVPGATTTRPESPEIRRAESSVHPSTIPSAAREIIGQTIIAISETHYALLFRIFARTTAVRQRMHTDKPGVRGMKAFHKLKRQPSRLGGSAATRRLRQEFAE